MAKRPEDHRDDQDAASTDGYEVGYGKPPRHSRFAPGTSGNPKGRPKGSRNLDTLIRDEAAKFVAVREGGKVPKRRKQDVLVAGIFNLAMQGNLRATDLLMSHLQRIQASQAGPGAAETISSQEGAIVVAFRRREAGGDEP